MVEKSKNSINVEGGFLFCGGRNFSKSVSVGPTFIREMRVMLQDTALLLKPVPEESSFWSLDFEEPKGLMVDYQLQNTPMLAVLMAPAMYWLESCSTSL